MAEEKCFSCRNSATKGPISNLDDARSCPDCGAFYHPSCYDRAVVERQKGGKTPKCCELGFFVTQPLDKATFTREMQALRSEMDGNHKSILEKFQTLENKVENKLKKVNKKIEDVDKRVDACDKKIDEHENRLLDVDEKVHLLEQNSESWQKDAEVIILQNNEKLKRETTAKILSEVAERQRRENHVIVYNLAGTEKNDIKLLLSNFPDAPFKESDVYVRRLKSKKQAVNNAVNKDTTVQVIEPLKVFFQKREYADWLLLHSKQGSNPTVKCVHDRTPLQRDEFNSIFDEFNKRKNDGETDLQIKFIGGIPQIRKNKLKNSKNPTQQIVT